MLHALLHRKLDHTIPEPQRFEDALTSTAFGALVLVEAWDTLARWLKVESPSRESLSATGPYECWFWPRLGGVEPDVVVRLGDTLVVVEAKYWSDRHDVEVKTQEGAIEEQEVKPSDQLVRQYEAFTTPPDRRVPYFEALELAIRQCRLKQVFLVNSRKLTRARKEERESRKKLPREARLELVTWQQLFRLLGGAHLRRSRWAVDLRWYLIRTELDTFEGIERNLPHRDVVRATGGWRMPQKEVGAWQPVVERVLGFPVGALRGWFLSSRSADEGRIARVLDYDVLLGAAEAIAHWRATAEAS